MEGGERRELLASRRGRAGFADREPLFADEAIREIYYATQGYPRRIALLCHDALERLVMDHQPTVSVELIRSLVSRERELQSSPLTVAT